MVRSDLLDAIRRLPLRERLAVLEESLHDLREDFTAADHEGGGRVVARERDRKLQKAAERALPLYSAGGELTAFTALDGDPFYDHESE
jgi:hypothetical protein